MNETLTVEQVIKIVIDNLNKINLPCSMIESVGFPISQAVHNLQLCVEAMENEKEKAEKPEEEAGDINEPETDAE